MRTLLLLLFILPLLSGCDTRREIIDTAGTWVRVQIDWSQSGITPNGTTIWFFPRENGEKPRVLRTHNALDSILLAKNTYSVIVFNETESDHDYISFRGTDRYETFEAYAKSIDISGRYARAEGENPAATPDPLGIAAQDEFVVTGGMVARSEHPTLSFTPRKVTVITSVTAYVKEIDNIALRGSAASLSGMAEGINLATGLPTSVPVTHYFYLTDKQYDAASPRNGTLSARVYSFGQPSVTARAGGGIQNVLTLYLFLRNGDMLPPITKDVTRMVGNGTGGGKPEEPALKIEIGSGDDPEITLPEVPDTGKPDAGFDADVNDWGDEIITDIPL